MPIAPKRKFSVGRDCDAWCTRCRMDLAHTIVAMVDGLPVQVICNTCNGKHKYRPPKGEGGPKTAARRTRKAGTGRTTKAEREAAASADLRHRQWKDLIAQHNGHDARRYNVRESFSASEAIGHSKFGVGFVIEELGFSRIKVLFEDGERTLVINHGKKPEG